MAAEHSHTLLQDAGCMMSHGFHQAVYAADHMWCSMQLISALQSIAEVLCHPERS